MKAINNETKASFSLKLPLFAVIFAISVLMISSPSAWASADKFPLTPVSYEKVCMVTDNVMDKPLIPVKVDDKTYYGCCQGCVGQLTNNRAVRYSTDPLTGKEVDKAMAFILSGDKGQALYFESKDTAANYLKKQ